MGNLALTGFDDIFNSDTPVVNGICITEIPLEELHTPEFHPFYVREVLCCKGCEKQHLHYNIATARL